MYSILSRTGRAITDAVVPFQPPRDTTIHLDPSQPQILRMCISGGVCLPGEKQGQSGTVPCQLCTTSPSWGAGVEGHRWFPRQPRQRPDERERVPGECTKKTKKTKRNSTLCAVRSPLSLRAAASLHPLHACPPSNGWKFMQKTAEIWEDTMLMASNAACIFFYAHITPLLPPPPPAPSPPHPTPTLPLQICVGKNAETDGFLRLSSGKRKGLVPMQYVQEVWWRILLNGLWEEEVHSNGGITQECSTRHLPPFCQNVAMNRIEAWVDADPPVGFFFSENLL